MIASLIILILASQPCFSAEISPYLDPSVQDYVETSHGYMAERGNFVQDLRDALAPMAEFKSPVSYVLRIPAGPSASQKKTSKAELPGKSRLRPFSSAEKKKLLARLNSFSTEEVKDLATESGGDLPPENSPAGGRLRFAGEAGSLAFAVPPVDSPGSGYLYVQSVGAGSKSDVYLNLKIPSGAEPQGFLGMVLREMNRTAGFVWKKTVALSVSNLADSGPDSAPVFTVTVLGNVPADGVRKLFECPFVTRIE